MPTSEQLKTLIKSHLEGDENRFFSCAMQIAAHEARVGHGQFAKELRDLIDAAKRKQNHVLMSPKTVPIVQPKGELASLLTVFFPKAFLPEMVLDDAIASRLKRIIKEQRQIEKIRSYGLSPRRKLLLIGPPGTGKTMTSFALAGELSLPLFVIRLDGVITKFMGETSAKLRLIFDAINQHRGIYLFDEFDSIGTMRGTMNDVGEIRRVLNSFFQFIDQDESISLILAATNHPEILDYALFRRFDDVIEYSLPEKSNRIALMQNKLSIKNTVKLNLEELAKKSDGLSYAEIVRACEDAVKDVLIHNRKELTQNIMVQMLSERKRYYKKTTRVSPAHK